MAAVIQALEAAKRTKDRLTVIVADTIKGKGISFAENDATFHNAALTEEQHRQAVTELEQLKRRIMLRSMNSAAC